MRSLLKLVLVDDATPEGVRRREERRRRIRVEDYLDHLCAPLVGVVPYEERLALRTETEEHLYALMEDREGEGLAPAVATDAALREHGEPWRIGQQFADAYLRAQTEQERARATTLLSRHLGAATLRAFAFFGAASVATVLTNQYAALTPGAHDRIGPWLVLLGFCGPLVAGTATGLTVPVRPGRAVGTAMGVVLVHSAGASLVMWPQRDGLYLLLAQALWWLPAGLLAAILAGAASRHLRRTLYLRGATR